MQLRLWLLAVVLVLTACGGSQTGDEPPAAQAERKPTVFDPLTSTIDRAKSVQQTIDDTAARERQRLEEAER